MPTVKENLIAARALIDTPEKWGREEYHDAVTGCMCVIGAVARAAYHANARKSEDGPEYTALWAQVPDQGNYAWLYEYNDHPDTTHADIMDLFDRAIAAQDGVS